MPALADQVPSEREAAPAASLSRLRDGVVLTGRRRMAVAGLVMAVVAAASAALLLVGVMGMTSGGGGISARPVVGFGADTLGSPAASPPDNDAGPAPTGRPRATAPPVARAEPPPVPVRSGRLAEVPVVARPAPTLLTIESLGITAPVAAVGYVAETAEMEVPGSASVVGWYEFSASPGSAGSAVLAAHVDWNGQPGAFFELRRIRRGAIISVGFDDGSVRRFEVVAAHQYDKQVLPTDTVFARDGAPLLRLVTCGGLFDDDERAYRDNIVVVARPFASADLAPS